ncbi:hypothetical protein PAHAL_2G280600 [Panicum hallii]|jgi:hypothetical protein|uniref:DUF1618 domain-containing protein n=1 Tax=Panicum hallii TaxID=206008 RepID=A0A2S3GZX9_9POAL|nr:hypothetical protein PAHAL_2G280600 [Panicum hallii]
MGKRRRTGGDVAGREAKRRGQKKQRPWTTGTRGTASTRTTPTPSRRLLLSLSLCSLLPNFAWRPPGEAKTVLFGATGSKILALWQPRNRTTRAVVYDTATGSVLGDGPAHPVGLHPMRFVASGSGGGRLHALHAGGLHCLDLNEAKAEDPYSYAAAYEADARLWCWTRACSPLRLPFLTKDGTPAPSGPIAIASYAVHPEGRTVFVSAFRTYHRYFGTFSLDTGAARAEWTRHGEWLLPFRGQGHYDSTLDAWVGLHSPGYVCACDVPPPLPAGSGERPRPEWKLVKAERLSDTDPEDGVLRQSLMTLASMGDAEFLILEPLTTEVRELNVTLDMNPHFEYMLRVTRFRLKHNRQGQLRESSRDRVARCYKLRKYDDSFAPQAFWL